MCVNCKMSIILNLIGTRSFLFPASLPRNPRNPSFSTFSTASFHRILGVNSFLFTIGLIDSPLCTFCKTCGETLSHLFWDCPVVVKFWSDAVFLFFNKLNVFFGDVNDIAPPPPLGEKDEFLLN